MSYYETPMKGHEMFTITLFGTFVFVLLVLSLLLLEEKWFMSTHGGEDPETMI
jgi:membrane-bound metal-dependent hydrolase YbcI (DUF457 family)